MPLNSIARQLITRRFLSYFPPFVRVRSINYFRVTPDIGVTINSRYLLLAVDSDGVRRRERKTGTRPFL